MNRPQATATPQTHDATQFSPTPSALNGEILRFIERNRLALGLRPEQMRILDWGCGRGAYVEHLRRAGYDAYGVDIADGAIAEARQRIAGFGCDPVKVIRKISVENQTDFDAGMFHLVFSFQVLEHVSDLATLATEVRRISRSGAVGVHIFPAKWRPLEVHLRMPLVHWFPKANIRRWIIHMFLLLGVRPPWREPLPTSARDRAGIFFRYSCENTYYRSLAEITHEFRSNGFAAEPDVLSHPKLQALRWLPKQPLEWLIVHFWSVQLACRL